MKYFAHICILAVVLSFLARGIFSEKEFLDRDASSNQEPTRDQAVSREETEIDSSLANRFLPEDFQVDECEALSTVSEVRSHQNIWQVFERAKYAIRPITDYQRTMAENVGAEFIASTPAQNFRARFLSDGLRIISNSIDETWCGSFRLKYFGEPSVQVKDSTIYYQHGNVLEWFVNTSKGIEHWFEVAEKPKSESAEPLKLEFELGDVKATELSDIVSGSEGLAFVSSEFGPILSYTHLRVWDRDGAELPSRMYPTEDGYAIEVADSQAVYPITIDPVFANLRQQLRPAVDGTGSAGDGFGWSLDVYDNLAVLGASGDSTSGVDSGSAYIFEYEGGQWIEQAKLFGEDAAVFDRFGQSLSVYGSFVAIGASKDDTEQSDTGGVYVFKRDGKSWTQIQKIVPEDVSRDDAFGTGLYLSENVLIVGSPGDDDNGASSGSVYIYERVSEGWDFVQKITAPDGAKDDGFGECIRISGDVALISAVGDDDNGFNSGSVYAYRHSLQTGEWYFEQKLLASDGDMNDLFGSSVDIEGEVAVIGAYLGFNGSFNSGSAYVYRYGPEGWVQEQKLIATDSSISDRFGFASAILGDTIAIGAHSHSQSRGAVYIFERLVEEWVLQSKIDPDGLVNVNEFGHSLSADGERFIVGAYTSSNNGSGSGAAYSLTLAEQQWEVELEIDPGFSASELRFGQVVATHGDFIAVGAQQDGDNGVGSGAAYLFKKANYAWELVSKIIAPNGESGDDFGANLDLDDHSIVISAPSTNQSSGSIYFYENVEDSWHFQIEFDELSEGTGDILGEGLALDGNFTIAGGYRGNTAYSFTRDSNYQWHFEEALVPFDFNGFGFGNAVAIDGGLAVISAPGSSKAYILERTASGWSFVDAIYSHDNNDRDGFGASVSIYDGLVAVGAPSYDIPENSNSGILYFFKYQFGYWDPYGSLQSSQPELSERFGMALEMDRDFIVVGSREGGLFGHVHIFGRSEDDWGEVQESVEAYEPVTFVTPSIALEDNRLVIGEEYYDGADRGGSISESQGAVLVFELTSSKVDSDGDGASDDFEVTHQLDSQFKDDFSMLDSDGDGQIDLLEIFHGSDHLSADDRSERPSTHFDSEANTLTVVYTRDPGADDILVTYKWSTNLSDWYVGGVGGEGIYGPGQFGEHVDFRETVIESTAEAETVEVELSVSAGSPSALYMRIYLQPR